MTIYNDFQSLTTGLLKEFKQGTLALVQSSYSSTASPDDPGTAVESTYPLDGVVKGVSKKYVQLAFAVASDLEVTTAVLNGITPTEKDFIEIDGTRYKIVQDISTPAAGTKVAWKFIVRRGG